MSSKHISTPHSRNRTALVLGIAIALGIWASSLFAQSLAPAVLTSPIEFGGGYSTATSDYTTRRLSGFGLYADYNIGAHLAAVATYHRLTTTDKDITESTISAGIRAHQRIGPFTPFIQAVAGEALIRSVVSGQSGTSSSVLTGGGGGAELVLPKRLALRFDYEYQRWLPVMGFAGLNAQVETFGLTYRVPPGYGRER